MGHSPQIAIVENGSQTTLLFGHRFRQMGVSSIILKRDEAEAWVNEHDPRAVILSGGHASVFEDGSPRIPESWLPRLQEGTLPTLGVCYGMEVLTHQLGGTVERGGFPEFGPAEFGIEYGTPLLANMPSIQQVWMSHSDSIAAVPPGFGVIARGKDRSIAAMMHPNKKVFGILCHPEVDHTPHGSTMLSNFAFDVAGCVRDWTNASEIETIRAKLLATVGPTATVALPFSGGVDSTVAATLASVLGDRCVAFTMDAGQLEDDELDEIKRHAALAGVKNHLIIDMTDRVEELVGDELDAEKKRKKFTTGYRECCMRVVNDVGAAYVVHGTLGPDDIESGLTGGVVIKSHHNVGWEVPGVVMLHPMNHLFKSEVRVMARDLGLPKSVSEREPSPGPGDYLRVIGAPANRENRAIVKWARKTVKSILRNRGLYEQISQVPVGFFGVPTSGVKGDTRSYHGFVAVRPLVTDTFLTAKGFHLPPDVEDEIISAVTAHPQVVRVMFDYTPKGPATMEFQ